MGNSLQFCDDSRQAARKAAEFTVLAAAESLRERGAFFWAISEVAASRGFFENLAELGRAESIAWDKCHVFWTDWRFAPPGSIVCQSDVARLALATRVGLSPSLIHEPPATARSPQEAAEAYEAQMRRVMGAGVEARFDLIHLGLGADGRTAGLTADDPVLKEMVRWAAPAGSRTGDGGAVRITLTLPALNAARRVLFLVNGEYKLALAERIISGRETADLPAAMVAAGETLWVLGQ